MSSTTTPRTPDLPQGLADELNLAANFLPQNPAEEGTLPSLQTGGAQVDAYWEPGAGLCVSVHLDTGEVPDVLTNEDGTISVRITVNGEVVHQA
ncbi:hypothetical protein ACFY64_31800 [Streptomyces collinus]|uniref:hypothetical protein n=1 Tax=Streptomyces collinus TaxID=42684 RepID=UPI0036AE4CA5